MGVAVGACKHGTSSTAKVKSRKRSSGFPTWITARRRYWGACVRRNQSKDIGMPSMKSFSGTVRAQTVVQHGRGDPVPHCPREARPRGGTINLRLAAVRRLTYEAADADMLSPELAAGHPSDEGCLETRREAWELARAPGLAGSRCQQAQTQTGPRHSRSAAWLRVAKTGIG
jgi:hypothetical protein